MGDSRAKPQPAQGLAPQVIITTMLSTIEDQIIPLLRESVAAGNMPFGAAVLSSSVPTSNSMEPQDSPFTPVTVSSNRASEVSPLLHGETNCIREFFELKPEQRPRPQDCVFISTHEPCSLCLSGLAWTGFPVIWYLFTYEETAERLGVPQDQKMLEEVFRVRAPGDTDESLRRRPLYNQDNAFWSATWVHDIVERVDSTEDRRKLLGEVKRIKGLFEELENKGKHIK